MALALELFDEQNDTVSFSIARNLAQFSAEKKRQDRKRLHFAQSFCGCVLSLYWKKMCLMNDLTWKIRHVHIAFRFLTEDDQEVTKTLAQSLIKFPVSEAGYFLGTLYTVMLPDKMRARLGAYYTPPSIVQRLMTIIGESGFDWTNGLII